MKTIFLGSMAVALGFSIAGSAGAQGGYPAAGYTYGTQARTVPVHPSLRQPASEPQQAAAQLEWPVNQSQQPANPPQSSANGSPPLPFAPQWSEGQPGFAAQQRGVPQTQLAAQPRFLPQPYRAASTGNSADGDPQAGNSVGADGELLPETIEQPNEASSQPPAPAQPVYGESSHPQSFPVGPNGQPLHHHPSPYAGGHPSPYADGEADYSLWNARPVGSFLRNSIGAGWPGADPRHHCTDGACGPGGCGPAPAPVAYGPAPLRKWFGGADLLFLTTEENCDRRLLFDMGDRMPTLLSSGDVDPDGDVGFDVFLGRYLHGGRHALMVKYFFFDPDGETSQVDEPAAGVGAMGNPYDYRVPMLGWNNISYDVGMDGDPMNDVTVYDRYDDSISFRARRNVSFQGIEANFLSFGLGGAHRGGVGPMACPCGDGCGPKRGCAGPMIAGCNSKLQIRTTHGLRWFQFKDAFEFAASDMDYVYGTTEDDIYYDLDTENNLYGYQFGTRVDYALGCKVNVYAGGKFGIFANDAEFRSRIGTREMAAYVNDSYPVIEGDSVMTEDSDTVLSTLGELDLGVGYRVNCCWTVRGGYRLYGMTGVATTVGSMSDDAAHLPSAGNLCADDSIFLHGGYVGAEYNW